LAAARFILVLLIVAVGLPILLCVLMAVGRLLAGMGDAAGAEVVSRIALGLFIVWLADLVGLVVVQAVVTLVGQDHGPDELE
jgi:hypothetical protein